MIVVIYWILVIVLVFGGVVAADGAFRSGLRDHLIVRGPNNPAPQSSGECIRDLEFI